MLARQLARKWHRQAAKLAAIENFTRSRASTSAVSSSVSAEWLGAPGAVARTNGSGVLGVADIASVPAMKSSDLRRLSEAAAAAAQPGQPGTDPRLWDAISARCQAFAEQMNYWDSVMILQAYASSRVEHQDTLLRLGEALCAKTTQLAPKHCLDILAVYEAYNLRPRALYVELFHAIIRLSRSMYAEEASLALQALARYEIGNPTVVSHLVRTVMRQLSEFRLRYLCSVAGALGSLDAWHDPIFRELDKRAKFEVETIALQELLDNIQAFPKLEFSWRPYEELCMHEFMARVDALETFRDVDQLVDPFDALAFLKARGLLKTEFLEALTQWCLSGVHKPNVRSERRPTAKQLVMLHDECVELGIEETPALQDAILYYVESGGGRWPSALPPPLKYKEKRVYIRSPDPMEALLIDDGYSVESYPSSLRPRRRVPDLPGLPGLSDSQDLFASSDSNELEAAGIDEPKRKLPSKGETVTAVITSRRSPRPRVRKDVARKRLFRKWGRVPLWYQGGYEMRPKYQQGVATKRYPWSGVPVGRRGAAWVMRR